MTQKALVIAWPHPTDTVASLASQLAEGLIANNIAATVFDLGRRRHREKLVAASRNFFDHVFLLGSVPLQIKFDGVPIYEHFEANFYFWVLDPIVYDFERIPATWDYFTAARNSDRLFSLFPDRSYMDLVEDYLHGGCIYFPFAGNYSRAAVQGGGAPAPKRSDVLVLANIGNELSEFASRSLADIVDALDPFGLDRRRKDTLVDRVMNDERYSNVTQAVRDYLQLDANTIFTPPVVAFLAALDASEKRRRRLAIVGSIKSLAVDIVGLGWRELMGERPNFVYQAFPFRHEWLPNHFANYKVLLDFSPNWDHGFNDRVLTCLGAGCRVVTSRNAAIDELGEASVLTSTYSTHRPKPEPDIEKALHAPPVDEGLIAAIRIEHNWTKRVSSLLCRI